MLEIELKVRVPDLAPIREALRSGNARFLGKAEERDAYYNAPHRNFRKTDEARRGRLSEGRAVLTYKGPKIKSLRLKAREELNTGIESGPVAEEILEKLGFVRTAAVNKVRESYALGKATVSLDEVEGLGTFVEIEVISTGDREAALNEIGQLKKELGITGEAILDSYLELLSSKP